MAMKIIRIILFLIFLGEGGTKILGFPFQITAFVNWGYPLWFMYLIGVLEILGAFGLLVKPIRLYANIGLLLIMVGAFYTHIASDDTFIMMAAAILVSVLLLIHLNSFFKKKKPGEFPV